MNCTTFILMYVFVREYDEIVVCQLFDYDGQSVTYITKVNDFNWTDDFGCSCPFYLIVMMELHPEESEAGARTAKDDAKERNEISLALRSKRLGIQCDPETGEMM